MHEQLEVGDESVFSRMASDFPLKESEKCDEHVFIAGGAAITAFLASVRFLKEQGYAFKLYYATKRKDGIAFKYVLNNFGENVKLCVSEDGTKA